MRRLEVGASWQKSMVRRAVVVVVDAHSFQVELENGEGARDSGLLIGCTGGYETITTR